MERALSRLRPRETQLASDRARGAGRERASGSSGRRRRVASRPTSSR
jgi:hypothetical protein